jgi:hypothetical protein
MQQMVIANRLRDGLVVFLAAGDDWVESIDAGVLAENETDSARMLQTGRQAELDCKIIDANLIDVVDSNGSRKPTAIREAIRAAGPTVTTTASDE